MSKIMNPAVSEKVARIGDLLILRERAALNVQAPNPNPLEGVTISTEPVAPRLAAYDASVTGAEQIFYDGICTDLVQAVTELAALPVMIEAPPAP